MYEFDLTESIKGSAEQIADRLQTIASRILDGYDGDNDWYIQELAADSEEPIIADSCECRITLSDNSVFCGLLVHRISEADALKLRCAGYAHSYDIRHADDDESKPSTIEKQVVVNYYGTFFSKMEIPLMFNYGEYSILKELELLY